ncbi:MAG: glycosyltransferase family 4 protein [Candidatus Peregrinibacteria bacterium]
MKLLFTRFPLESAHGGAEVQTMALMHGLVARGHGVAFLGSCPTLLELCESSGILSGELLIGPPPVSAWHAISFLWRKESMEKKLLSAIAEFGQMDAIVMLSLTEKLLLTEPLVRQGMKVFWIEHDGIGRWLTSNPWLPLLKRNAKLATTIVVSDLSRDLYKDLGWPSERIVSIPNGIDLARLVQKTEADFEKAIRYPLSATRFRIATIARLTPDKGVDVLIDAITDFPNCHLTIVGKGPEEGYLRKLIDERHISDRVEIIPRVENLGAFLDQLQCFVLPSRSHDPFGLVAGEAMAMGVPTIVTDACGISYHVVDGTEAIVVPADDVSALREAIVSLDKPDIWSKLSENGKRAVAEKFSMERMVEEYEMVMSRGQTT